jgi:hypothetical protein
MLRDSAIWLMVGTLQVLNAFSLSNLSLFAAAWVQCSSVSAVDGTAVEWAFLKSQYISSPTAGWCGGVAKRAYNAVLGRLQGAARLSSSFKSELTEITVLVNCLTTN